MSQQQIKDIHVQSGHPGIKRMLHVMRRINPAAAKAEIKQVYEMCQSIDLAPARQWKEQLEASDAWQWVGMDIAHYGGNYFLTLIDCGPTCFTIWRPLACQDLASILWQLSFAFYKKGALEEILADNDTTFCSQQVRQFLYEWGVPTTAAMHICTIR